VLGITSPDSDGTFSIENVVGRSALHVQSVPAGWMVKAIRLDGMDIADQEIDFAESARRSVEIVLTDRIADVAGVVSDNGGRPVSNYTAVVFPVNRARWEVPSRLIRGVRPRRDGSYRVAPLPAGDYLAVAIDSLPLDAWNDTDVLERLSLVATPFRLGDAEHRTVDLQLAELPAALKAQLVPRRGSPREPGMRARADADVAMR
jgi:hypothetical protein